MSPFAAVPTEQPSSSGCATRDEAVKFARFRTLVNQARWCVYEGFNGRWFTMPLSEAERHPDWLVLNLTVIDP